HFPNSIFPSHHFAIFRAPHFILILQFVLSYIAFSTHRKGWVEDGLMMGGKQGRNPIPYILKEL
ncbi:MAG TPA: hypothetical protein P5041_01030, partial [Candidatus Cloacimonas sp.]|nr:hypothetical protein [Candidatus Cloacimonas sp.]